MIGMMMAVHAIEHLHAHAKEAGGLPLVDARLHQPSCRRVAQSVGRDISSKFCEPDCGLEGSLDRVWSKYWSEASISSIENLIALITVPVPHRRPG